MQEKSKLAETIFTTHVISRTKFTDLGGLPAEGDMIQFFEIDSPVFVVENGDWVLKKPHELTTIQQVVASSALEEIERQVRIDESLNFL